MIINNLTKMSIFLNQKSLILVLKPSHFLKLAT